MGWETFVKLEVYLTKKVRRKDPDRLIYWLAKWLKHQYAIHGIWGDYLKRMYYPWLHIRKNESGLHVTLSVEMRKHFNDQHKFFLLDVVKTYFGKNNILYAHSVTNVDGYARMQLDCDKLYYDYRDLVYNRYDGRKRPINIFNRYMLNKKILEEQKNKMLKFNKYNNNRQIGDYNI